MTIPFQNLPDTRPGYAFQNPGDIGALAGGLDAVLAALIQRSRLDQNQQQIGIEQQRADQYKRQLDMQAAAQQAAREAAQAQAGNQQQVGSALQAMLQGLQLPNMHTGPLNLESAAGLVAPQNVTELLKQGQPIQKERDAKKAEADKLGAQRMLLGRMPTELRGPVQAMLEARAAGLDDVASRNLMEALAGQPSPQLLAQIDKAHPEWAHLSGTERRDQFIKEIEATTKARTEARFRPPQTPKGSDGDNVPAGIVTAVRSNEKVIQALEQAKADILANPTAIGWVNRIPGIADARDVLEARRGDVTGGITRAATAEGGQLIIYDNTGKAVNIEELKRSRQIPTIKDPPELAIAKIDRMIERAKSSAQFMREVYSPDYGFKPMLQKTTPGVVTPPQTKGQSMSGITGTYKP